MTLLLDVERVLATPDPAAPAPPARPIGRSRQGRELFAHRFGNGPLSISLIAGCHADEPVGPATLRRLAGWLAALPPDAAPLTAATWSLVPDANPDGAAVNAAWSGATVPVERPGGRGTGHGYDLAAYLAHAVREPPGDDVEFGFPRTPDDRGARPENQAVAAFLAEGGRCDLHASLHGMGFAAGPWFLLEPSWLARTAALRPALGERVAAMGYRLHDVDRGGDKGFVRIAPGFCTRPDSRAMAAHFEQRDEPATAALFRPSSMEHARSLGGDPLTLVSEMPLFTMPWEESGEDGPPLPIGTRGKLRFRRWADQALAGDDPEALRRQAARWGIRPMAIEDQSELQLAFLAEGLAAVIAAGGEQTAGGADS